MINAQINNTRSAQRARPSQAVKDEIVQLFRSGESAEDVANCFGVGVSSVYSWSKAASIKEQMRKTRAERRMAASISKDIKDRTMSLDKRPSGNDDTNMGTTALRDLVAKQAAEIEVLKQMLLEALLKTK